MADLGAFAEKELSCEHMFVTSQGSAHGRLRHAIDRGHVNFALEAAAELPTVPLTEALELCRLLAASADHRYPAAARRWLGRFVNEKRPSLNELLIAAAAMAELADRPNSVLARDTPGATGGAVHLAQAGTTHLKLDPNWTPALRLL